MEQTLMKSIKMLLLSV